MAVYTQLSSDDFDTLIAQYDVGDLVSVKGIAEGVSNSNWLVETTQSRFILTMYESRTELGDLPFFLGLLDHLAEKGSPVPRTIHDRDNAPFRMIGDKAVALIEFLSGVSIDTPSPAQAKAVGEALAGIHLNSADFSDSRTNSMALSDWRDLFDQCGPDGLASIDPALPKIVKDELAFLEANWPQSLPRSVVHADLFPDNVLMLGDEVSGLIDFYFACNDITAYDVAVTHAAWCFGTNGAFRPEIAQGLAQGYAPIRPLSEEEVAALPILGRAACMRFLSTRAFDWLNTPADALVTPKDPMAFVERLKLYTAMEQSAFPGFSA